MPTAHHRLACRVYYEDTDLSGLVYHANYLKFIERARSEWVRDLGIDQRAMKDAGTVFVVRRVEAEYLKPAKYDDDLTVHTTVEESTGARMILNQSVTRDGEDLFTARVTLVAMTTDGRATRLPAELRRDLH